MTMALGILAALLAAATQPLGAQTGATLIRAGGLVDVEAGAVRGRTLVEVRGGRIAAVRPDTGAVPPDARIIELPGAILLPGLIDTHVHLTLGGPADSNARATLLAGFTTVQDLGATNYANVALRDAVAAGRVTGPGIVASGPWLGRTGASCDFGGIGVRGAEAFRARVREDVRRGVDLIKICVTGWPQTGYRFPDSVEINREELVAAVSEARAANRRVAAHAIGAAGVRLALDVGVDVIVHAGFADDSTLGLMRARGVFLIPTLASFSGAQETPFGRALFQRMRVILASGVPIAFGTDAGAIPHGRNAREFTWLTRLGVPAAAALRAATVDAARLLGLEARLGRIAPGYQADVIAVRGNPLDDLSVLERVVFVMRDGIVQRLDSGTATRRP